jgi:hypothetical protein
VRENGILDAQGKADQLMVNRFPNLIHKREEEEKKKMMMMMIHRLLKMGSNLLI